MSPRETPRKRTNPSGTEVWVARYTDSTGKRRYAGTFRLKREAQAAIDKAYAKPVSRNTVGRYFEDWTDRYPRSERTDRTNRSRINAVLEVEIDGRKLRDWPWPALKRKHALELVDHMLRQQGRAVGGAQNHLRTLSAMAEDAITDELLDVNPFKGVRVRSNDRRAVKKPREPRVWTFEQMHTFAKACGRAEPMVRMLSDCGLRVGEMLALQRDLQDLRVGIFTVAGSAWNGELVQSSETKRHDRQGPIPPSTLAILQAVPPRIDSPWLFPTWGSERVGKKGFDLPGGLLWRYDNWMRKVWRPACVSVGFKPTPQEFRASFNSLMLAAGVDRADLADMLGHSENVNAERYTRALRRSGEQIKAVIG
jgi:integrase